MFTREEVGRIIKERESETDCDLGLPPEKVRETLQLLCRFLQLEAKHCADVSELYERTGLECPSELTTVGELIAFARTLIAHTRPEPRPMSAPAAPA